MPSPPPRSSRSIEMPVLAQGLDHIGNLLERRLEGRQLGQLRADMDVDPDDADAG